MPHYRVLIKETQYRNYYINTDNEQEIRDILASGDFHMAAIGSDLMETEDETIISIDNWSTEEPA